MSRRTLACLLCALPGAILPGCKGGQASEPFKLQDVMKKLSGPGPQERVAMAFDTEDPDKRREGIVLLSEKSWGLQEPYLKGYAAILASDDNPLVRSAAVRALGKARDPNYFKDIVEALSDESATVRWDAAVALNDILPALGAEPGRTALACRPLENHAAHDPSVDVRTASAAALRHFPDNKDAIKTLLQCLDDPEMGVRYRAHESLTAMTGYDMGYNAAEWASAVGGELPPALPKEPQSRWWEFSRPRPKTPATQPADRPATQPAIPPAAPARPWWDWFGVTDKPAKSEPATQPTTAPAGS